MSSYKSLDLERSWWDEDGINIYMEDDYSGAVYLEITYAQLEEILKSRPIIKEKV